MTEVQHAHSIFSSESPKGHVTVHLAPRSPFENLPELSSGHKQSTIRSNVVLQEVQTFSHKQYTYPVESHRDAASQWHYALHVKKTGALMMEQAQQAIDIFERDFVHYNFGTDPRVGGLDVQYLEIISVVGLTKDSEVTPGVCEGPLSGHLRWIVRLQNVRLSFGTTPAHLRFSIVGSCCVLQNFPFRKEQQAVLLPFSSSSFPYVRTSQGEFSQQDHSNLAGDPTSTSEGAGGSIDSEQPETPASLASNNQPALMDTLEEPLPLSLRRTCRENWQLPQHFRDMLPEAPAPLPPPEAFPDSSHPLPQLQPNSDSESALPQTPETYKT
ncbi:hypothetical protein BDN67DRAFT_985288 [Paxillus ammoniavirescens]|nr:hypothetical protein BDN67DRAFT_985288 [Paxillus ammoniavirescens]